MFAAISIAIVIGLMFWASSFDRRFITEIEFRAFLFTAWLAFVIFFMQPYTGYTRISVTILGWYMSVHGIVSAAGLYLISKSEW